MTAFNNLRYDRWVKERRQLGRQALGRPGRLPAHQGDGSTLAGEVQERPRRVPPQRGTGHRRALERRRQHRAGVAGDPGPAPYEVWQPRGVEPTERPFTGYFGPKVVLQNWRSASNAEMFPAGFRALGLGKVIGTPTMGAVIGTGSYSLIDGSSIRTPGVGVFLADTARTNMENHAVQPDIYVENTPEDNLAGHDRQLETAVAKS